MGGKLVTGGSALRLYEKGLPHGADLSNMNERATLPSRSNLVLRALRTAIRRPCGGHVPNRLSRGWSTQYGSGRESNCYLRLLTLDDYGQVCRQGRYRPEGSPHGQEHDAHHPDGHRKLGDSLPFIVLEDYAAHIAFMQQL